MNQPGVLIISDATEFARSRAAAASQRHAMLGRSMLETRHSFNNAPASVISNADLLLLEPGQISAPPQEQIRTIRTMALRRCEIMQRFSSLASEMQWAEKDSQTETEPSFPSEVSGPCESATRALIE